MEWLGIHPYQTSKYDLKKYLKNIPIKLEGIKISQDVCGTSITALKGKTVIEYKDSLWNKSSV